MLVLFVVKEPQEAPVDITAVKDRHELLKCKYGSLDSRHPSVSMTNIKVQESSTAQHSPVQGGVVANTAAPLCPTKCHDCDARSAEQQKTLCLREGVFGSLGSAQIGFNSFNCVDVLGEVSAVTLLFHPHQMADF